MKLLQSTDIHLAPVYGHFFNTRSGRTSRGASTDRLLRRMVRHAYEQVPFYRSLFDDHGVKPAHIRGAADLARLPIVSKKDLQSAEPSSLLAAPVRFRDLLGLRTSGSTGQPFTTYRTQAEAWLIGLGKLRIMREWGLRPGDRRAFVGVLSRFEKRIPFWFRLVKASGYFHRKELDLFDDPYQNARTLISYRPQILEGFPHALLQIAGILRQIGPGVVRPRFVVSMAEVLTAGMRQALEKTFQAPVYDLYSCTEFGCLAYECRPARILHLADRSGLVIEVLKQGRPAAEGEWGEITVTSLFSYAMPFIRFALGDLVMQGRSACACEKPYTFIRQVQGRMADCLILPGRKVIHPYQVTLLLEQDPFAWIRQYQIVQTGANRVELRIAPFEQPEPERLLHVRRALEALFGRGVAVDILVRASIEREAGGKIRVCRSQVASAYDSDANG